MRILDLLLPFLQKKMIQDVPDKKFSNLLDCFLTQLLHDGTAGQHPSVEGLARKLVEMGKNAVTARGTLGSILIDLGRVDEGSNVLHQVLAETKSKVDQFYSNLFLALAAQQKGDLATARALARLAQAIDPKSGVLDRVRELLSDTPIIASTTDT